MGKVLHQLQSSGEQQSREEDDSRDAVLAPSPAQ
jgi:hypothetical protein